MAVEKKKAPSPKKPKAEKKIADVAADPAKQVENKTVAAAISVAAKRRVLEGIVVSDKMKKTIVVKVDRRVRDTMYKKYVVRSRRFKAHDEKNEAKMGDLVTIIEAKPLSREKRWALCSIVRRGAHAPEVNV